MARSVPAGLSAQRRRYRAPSASPIAAPAVSGAALSALPSRCRSGANARRSTTGAVAVQPTATLACPIVSTLDTWFAERVQPAALSWFGQPVAEIRQISAYSCRGMNGQRGARISEHAFGNALDIASFTLADGRKITVKDGWRGVPEEQGFLRDVHASACQQFINRARARLERVPLRPHPCRPDAARERARDLQSGRRSRATWWRRAPAIASARAASRCHRLDRKEPARKPAFRTLLGRDEVYEGLPRAVPGED